MADISQQEELAVAEGGNTVAAVAEKNARQHVESSKTQQVLNTPRTREACRRLGLVLEDLQFRDKSEFAIPGDLKEKQLLRFEHHEKRRKKWLADVLAERAKVIAQEAQKGNMPGVQSGQFLSMLESLFEKEAKRLESDLKGQLRQHSSLVKENEEQLRKESELQHKLMTVEKKRAASMDHFRTNHGELAKNRREQKRNVRDTNLEVLEKTKADKNAKLELERLAEEERLAKFEEQRIQNVSDQTLMFRARMETMKEKQQELKIENLENRGKMMADLDRKMSEVAIRREEDARLKQVRAEEQHLHVLDVREAKTRIERVAGYRRDELREQVEGNIERIETLLALKDQLLDQRKARNIKQEATKGSRGLNLRRDCLPGPGQYEAPESTLMEAPGGKIGRELRVGIPDDKMEAAKFNPAPGMYDVKVMANGKSITQTCQPSKISERKKETYLDVIQKEKEIVPAPGKYEKRTGLDHRGAVMARDKVVDKGLDAYSVKRLPQWQRPATETPGPAGYNVDQFMRKEVLRRAQRSLPNLTRDMLGPNSLPTVKSN